MRWDIVAVIRVLGVIVILAGAAVTAWSLIDIADEDLPFRTILNYQIRTALSQMIQYLSYGGLLIIAAEAVDRLTRTRP